MPIPDSAKFCPYCGKDIPDKRVYCRSCNTQIEDNWNAFVYVYEGEISVGSVIQKGKLAVLGDRGKFICQSQSLNLFMEAPNFSKLSSMHFYAWQKGLKTGIYYLRSRPSSKAIQFTIAPETCENCSA